MKHKVTPVKALAVTVHCFYLGEYLPRTKTVRKAVKAAEFYASTSCYSWWNKTGHLISRPDAYEDWRDREARMLRRVLPIFQQYLP
jgi:hypothetical protein